MISCRKMAFFKTEKHNTCTIVSIISSPPLLETNDFSLSNERPISRITSHLMTRKPDHNARVRNSFCPFNFRFALWCNNETQEQYLDTCDYCTTKQTKKNRSRYQYTALEPDSLGQEHMELERKARQQAQIACKYYLRVCPRYTLLQHLNDIGSRVDKHWFVVRDGSVKTERLLTLVPKNPKSVLECTLHTRDTIVDLFLTLQHPYIYPVLDIEFVKGTTNPDTTFITLVLPFNSKGSLKDLIYKSCWHDDWSDKYGQRSEGLPLSQIQRLGRQILEALLFLKKKKFPHDCNLHSGNVILQNGVARITGLENSLLGFTSRIHPLIMSGNLELDDFSAVDVVCFGHVLFEMAAGYELVTPEPSDINLNDIAHYPQVVEITNLIFKNSNNCVPTIEQLVMTEFFRNIDLREMRAKSWPVLQARMTPSSSQLLESVRNRNSCKIDKCPENHNNSLEMEKNKDNLQNRKFSMRSKSCEDEKYCHAKERKSVFDNRDKDPMEHRSLSLYHRQQSLDFQLLG
ncbi:slowpoke-binding protein isoform X2 [Daktulosphaira vitifoliae]|uniref:slowpoke-binding protein isoform X2 n=1 Tax=Daktulosphaira vitifoliae TaxID=58002 RepID=UPI0021A9CF99|nr:slowpoke-binding protein isoform X2 [Daktulosphaira vitifoliae]